MILQMSKDTEHKGTVLCVEDGGTGKHKGTKHKGTVLCVVSYWGEGYILKKSHIIELQKVCKKYEFLKLAHHVLMWIGVILYFGIIVFNFLNLWVIGHIRFYIGLVTVLFGFPMLIIRKK